MGGKKQKREVGRGGGPKKMPQVFPGVDLSAFCVNGSCPFHSVLVHSRAVGPPDLMQSPLWATPGFACPGRRPTEILWKVA